MLKTLGRSVYLTRFEEQRASLSAFAAGGAPVFISLHISEEFDAAYCARVQEMCDFLSAQGWRILADVSEKTIRQFGCADLTALAKRLHLWGLRLDYGFSVEQMCALAQQLPVAVNASTTTPEVARQLAAGGGTVIAMHNFYPRPETGLDPEFLRESTAALQAEGLQVYGFIPGDALLRGPLYKGLPTLEAHRTAALGGLCGLGAELRAGRHLCGRPGGEHPGAGVHPPLLHHRRALPAGRPAPRLREPVRPHLYLPPGFAQNACAVSGIPALLLLWQHRAAGQLRGAPPPLRDHG